MQVRELGGKKAIEIESDADFSAILEGIIDSNYYTPTTYLDGGVPTNTRLNFALLAKLVYMLAPVRALDLGCGLGDVTAHLRIAGVEAYCTDFTADIDGGMWPDAKPYFSYGDMEDSFKANFKPGAIDTITGFDIFEHIVPDRLVPLLTTFVEGCREDLMMFCVIPAFGRDRIFGEIFPIDFDENAEFQRRHVPHRYLPLEKEHPPVPALGHLTNADSIWWESSFSAAGLVRCPEIEEKFHALDELLPASNRCFFVFRKASAAATERAAKVMAVLTNPEFSIFEYMAALSIASSSFVDRNCVEYASSTEERLRIYLTLRAPGTQHFSKSLLRFDQGGAVQYGPYVSLPAGEYIATWVGHCAADEEIELRVTSNSGKAMHASRNFRNEYSSLWSATPLGSVRFSISSVFDDFEFCSTSRGGSARVLTVALRRL
jgi:SAM-dependent methyltransferase